MEVELQRKQGCAMEAKKSEVLLQTLGMFAAKAAIVVVLLGVLLEVFLPDMHEVGERVGKNFRNERAKLYMLSFVQNPVALYKTSEIAERDSKLDSAVRDMELAIGLLEMHSADKQIIKRYSDRLDKLKAMVKEKK
jgi:hypothetical protein